ncbi:hypothetical protein HMI56_001699 [Coelomomyces lativittatus]|nr:hypothetical protein HMI56_001699 [Coelomomyces lativittatus]
MWRMKDEVFCSKSNEINDGVSDMRAKIENFFTIHSDKLYVNLDLPLLTSNLISFLNNPTKKHFEAFLPFSKESSQLYIPGKHKKPIQPKDNMYHEMKNTFSKFFETTDEIFEASQNLKLRQWSKSERNQNEDFKLIVKDETMTLIYKIFFNLIITIENDRFSYNKDLDTSQNFNYDEEIFSLNIRMFAFLLEYTFHSKYRVYCFRYGPFSGLQTYSHSPSSSNPRMSTPSIKTWYEIRILVFFTEAEPLNEGGRELAPAESFFMCEDWTKEIAEEFIQNSDKLRHNFLTKYSAFLKSNGIKKTLTFREMENEEKMFLRIVQGSQNVARKLQLLNAICHNAP